MNKNLTVLVFLFFAFSCGSGKTFNSFFNDHKKDLGAKSFQVSSFMMALVQNITPEIDALFGNISGIKFITFDAISKEKQDQLIAEMNLVTDNNFTDIFRENTLAKTKIVSVRERGNVVTQAIIFNTTLAKTSVFYLRGNFDPDKIREISKTNQFEKLSNKLIQNYQKRP